MSHIRPLQQKKINLLERILVLTLVLLLVSTLLKTAAGIFSGSIGFYADAVACLLLLLTTLLAISRLRRTAVPQLITFGRADRSYARIFSVMFTVLSLGLITLVSWHLIDATPLQLPVPALGSAGLAWLFMFSLAVYLQRSSRYYRLEILGTGARYLWLGIFTSTLILLAVALTFWTGWSWLDALIGFLQALVLLYVAYQLWTRSAATQPRVPASAEELRELKDLLHHFAEPRQISFSAIHGVRIGERLHFTVIMGVPETWTVVKAQRSADALEQEILQHFGGARVEIHLESSEVFQDPGFHQEHVTREDFRG